MTTQLSNHHCVQEGGPTESTGYGAPGKSTQQMAREIKSIGWSAVGTAVVTDQQTDALGRSNDEPRHTALPVRWRTGLR